ncbi:MAG: membrane protein insertion efficiency factor YidD [Pseudomonadota bacterium]|nr:membrane protein insertion efficiency factor YidD [Pseudomonadota bacterium]
MNPLSFILRTLIRLYQLFISPVLPGVCRHSPTCSEYALEAVRCHGALGGAWLALKRIGRCQPWGTSGHDPVPHVDCVHGHAAHGNRQPGA